MLPSISFGTGRRTQTQSSVRPWEGQDSKWKSGSISNRNRGREANTRGEETKKNLYPALLRSASGELLPLDKDLSWKSDVFRTKTPFVRFALPGTLLRDGDNSRLMPYFEKGKRTAREPTIRSKKTSRRGYRLHHGLSCLPRGALRRDTHLRG